jgi:hypothetical protein
MSKCQPRLLNSVKLSFLVDGEIKAFQNKVRLKAFMINNSASIAEDTSGHFPHR